MLLLLDLGRLTHRSVHLETSFRVDQVGCKKGVDHGRFAQSGLACKMSIRRMSNEVSERVCKMRSEIDGMTYRRASR
jgi:hypothetical protein